MSAVQFPTARGKRGGKPRTYVEPRHEESPTQVIAHLGHYYRDYTGCEDKSITHVQHLRRSLLRSAPRDTVIKREASRSKRITLDRDTDFSPITEIDKSITTYQGLFTEEAE